jgi:hypothetical protein
MLNTLGKKTLFVISAMTIAAAIVTVSTNIQAVSAQDRGTQRDIPQQAGCSPEFICEGDPEQNPTCGGGEEVRSAFPLVGTQVGPGTGLLNSGLESPEAHQELNQGWAGTAGACGSGTPGGP